MLHVSQLDKNTLHQRFQTSLLDGVVAGFNGGRHSLCLVGVIAVLVVLVFGRAS